MTFCNPGEGILMGQWTYSSAIAAMQPYGVESIPVALDSEGIRSDGSRKTLSEWDSTTRGMARFKLSPEHLLRL
jgi:aromatic amino acid aminotransferase I